MGCKDTLSQRIKLYGFTPRKLHNPPGNVCDSAIVKINSIMNFNFIESKVLSYPNIRLLMHQTNFPFIRLVFYSNAVQEVDTLRTLVKYAVRARLEEKGLLILRSQRSACIRWRKLVSHQVCSWERYGTPSQKWETAIQVPDE